MNNRVFLAVILLALASIACEVLALPKYAGLPTMPTDTPTPQQEAPGATETTSFVIYTVIGDWNIRDGASEESTKRGELLDGQMVNIRFCRPDGWCRLDSGFFVCGRAVRLAEACK